MDLCLFADVYGFSALVRSDLEGTAENLSKLSLCIVDTINNCRERFECSNIHLNLFSDNIQMVCKNTCIQTPEQTINQWSHFSALCTSLYELSFEHQLPLRGCVSSGEIAISGQQVLGLPIINAVQIEKHIRLPFIFVPEETLDQINKIISIDRSIPPIEAILEDIYFGDGILSVYPLLPSKNKLKQYAVTARKLYEAQRKIPQTSKSALDWRSYAIMLEKYGEQ
jgi:hypothetical protein